MFIRVCNSAWPVISAQILGRKESWLKIEFGSQRYAQYHRMKPQTFPFLFMLILLNIHVPIILSPRVIPFGPRMPSVLCLQTTPQVAVLAAFSCQSSPHFFPIAALVH